jgi:hypothetical protein
MRQRLPLLASEALVALSHLAVGHQRRNAGLVQRAHVVVAVEARIGRHHRGRVGHRLRLFDHRQQHRLL